MQLPKYLFQKQTDIKELYAQVNAQIEELLQWCSDATPNTSCPSPVSKWRIKDHLEHLSVTGRSTIMLIEQALIAKIPLNINSDGLKLFSLASFPRGKTKAPDFAEPKDTRFEKIRKNYLRFQNQLSQFSEKLDFLAKHEGTSEHPKLGHLTPKQWLQFVLLHQHHHLGIIAEINNALAAQTSSK